jgi:ankyrin repeat protein
MNAGANVDVQDSGGQTLLHWAAEAEMLEILKILISAGIKMDIKDRYGGNTALCLAVNRNENTKSARILVNAGANIDVQNDVGRTVLHEAVGFQKTTFVKMLLDAGANVDIQDNRGETALHLAVEKKSSGCVEMLVNAGANMDIKNRDGKTAIDLARLYSGKNREIVRMLMKAKRKHGRTEDDQ